MSSWHKLPLEIHDQILHYFCAAVAHDFEDLGATIWDTAEEDDFDAYHLDLTWPSPPQCLISFVAALRTSRYFHDTITNRTKLNGESPVGVMQKIQYQTILKIVDEFYDQVSSEPVSVKLFYKAAGCFWRNPMVLGVIDVPRGDSILGCVLMWIGPPSRYMLIPHLEHWLSRQAFQVQRQPIPEDWTEFYHRIPFVQEGGRFSEVWLKRGDWKSKQKVFMRRRLQIECSMLHPL